MHSILNNVKSIMGQLGENGPIFLFFLAVSQLWNGNREILLKYFTVGSMVSSIFNKLLKNIFKVPRPTPIGKEKPVHKSYGMPSGHMQSACFTTSYIAFAMNQQPAQIAKYIIMVILIAWQRVAFDHHTITQVLAGSIIGTGVGYGVYRIASKKILGKLSHKPDDNNITR
jgi:membrane-associated phospholipid phosphatase